MLYLKGLTKAEVITLLQNRLTEYLEEPPVVNIRFLNFKIVVNGEVNRPGTYTISDERISVPEALAKAGDMTIFGQRKDVMVYRVVDGKFKSYTIDMTSPSAFLSEAYFLQQNDMVYVKPNKSRVQSASYSPMISTYLSAASLLVGITNLVLTRMNK